MGPYQRTPKKVTRAIKYPGLGVRSVGPVGDFLDQWIPWNPMRFLAYPESCRLIGSIGENDDDQIWEQHRHIVETPAMEIQMSLAYDTNPKFMQKYKRNPWKYLKFT